MKELEIYPTEIPQFYPNINYETKNEKFGNVCPTPEDSYKQPKIFEYNQQDQLSLDSHSDRGNEQPGYFLAINNGAFSQKGVKDEDIKALMQGSVMHNLYRQHSPFKCAAYDDMIGKNRSYLSYENQCNP
jgi:hypothetical protein